MAGLFDGANSIVTATLPQGLQSSDWTMGAWINPNSAGEGNIGIVLQIGGSTVRQRFRFASSARPLVALQSRGTTGAQSQSTVGAAPAVGVWTLALATYRFSDDTCRLFTGTEKLPVTEMAYGSQTAGVGTYASQITDLAVGNVAALSQTFDGSIAHVVIAAREWSLAEMDHFRRTGRPASMAGLLAWLPIIGAAATEPDYSGQRSDGTPSLITQSAGPALNVPRVPSQRRRPVRP